MKFFMLIGILMAGSASQAMELIGTANYEVPGPDELKPFSHFPVAIHSGYNGPDTVTFSYTLPAELTGNPLTIVMNRVPGSTTDWTSDIMTSQCTESFDTFQCTMSFAQGINPASLVDRTKVASAFFAKNASITQVVNQLKVVNQFLDSEPVGILTYKIKSTPR